VETLPVLLSRFFAYLSEAILRLGPPLFAISVVLIAIAIIHGATLARKHQFSILLVLAYLFPPTLYRHTTAKIEAIIYLPTIFIINPLIQLVAAAIVGTKIRDYLIFIGQDRLDLFTDEWSAIIVQFLILWLARDFGFYVSHLALHKVPGLWSIHRVHHSAEALTFFTVARAHPCEVLVNGLGQGLVAGPLVGIALYALGTPLHPGALALWLGVGTFVFSVLGYLDHSHFRISFGPLNCVFSAPIMHQIHHSAEERHMDKNLGGTLMIFDYLFGTLYRPRRNENWRWGLNDREIGESNPHNTVLAYYIEPIQHCLRTLGRRSARAQPDNCAEVVELPGCQFDGTAEFARECADTGHRPPADRANG
jgi:sterol desaturase/sphingolipid hydroxylase (fatty acid hydroxylase superfamily)